MKYTITGISLAFAGFLLVGCASTPEKRIAANPEIFEALSEDQQNIVRQGHIDVGFTPEAVQLALGKPDEVVKRRTSDGEEVSWIFKGFRVQFETVHGFGGRAYSRFHLHRSFHTETISRREAFVRARVHFINDEVVAVEELQERRR